MCEDESVRAVITEPANNDPASGTGLTVNTRVVKHGEKTFASLTKIFNDFVTTISSI